MHDSNTALQAANQRVQALQEEVERLKKKLQTQTLLHVHPELAHTAPEIQPIDADVTSSVGVEPVMHFVDQELALVAQQETLADMKGPTCNIDHQDQDQDQDLGHDSSWDDGAAYSYDINPDDDAMYDTTTNNTTEQR